MTIKIVVPVSGGKDSQACLKIALELHGRQDVIGLFCDTQFEHPKTYAHVEWMRQHYGVHIETRTAGSVPEKVLKYGRFPGGGARHCTDELKMWPSKRYYKELAMQQGEGFEVWYGMRSDESPERTKRYALRISTDTYAPHEVFPGKYPKYLEKLGVTFKLPILDWTETDVKNVCAGELNPLYADGFKRVGCFPCLAGGDAAKEQAFAYDDFGAQQKTQVIWLSKQIGKSIWTSKGGAARNVGDSCAVCNM